MRPKIEKLLLDKNESLRSTIGVIDLNAQGMCFVTDKQGKFLGTITDGDIRRALLAGKSLESSVGEIVSLDCVSLPVGTSDAVIQGRLSEKIKIIPLVDANNVPVDYASVRQYHHIPVLEPLLDGNELEYVTDCIRSSWISSQGAYVTKFEQLFADYHDISQAAAVSNGTCALHLALEALGVGEGDEVIVPDFTFAASINSILHAGATPVLVDIHPDTWTIDPEKINQAITEKTKAIMVVHIYGHPCHMDEIVSIAKKHNLLLIEDCAESLGSRYKGKLLGTFGDAAAFSFFGNKIITTGEGGMLLTRDGNVMEKALMLRDHGMTKGRRYWHEVVGYNYRMTNIQAAIGVAQMERLDRFIEIRKHISNKYDEIFSTILDMEPQGVAVWAESSHWLYTVLVTEKCTLSRDELIDKLLLNGIECRPAFYPMHQMPPYKEYINEECPVSEKIGNNGISFPSSVTLKDSEINEIGNKLGEIFGLRQMYNGV